MFVFSNRIWLSCTIFALSLTHLSTITEPLFAQERTEMLIKQEIKNLTLYAIRREKINIEHIQDLLVGQAKATVKATFDVARENWTSIECEIAGQKIKLGYDSIENDGLTEHLSGFQGYVFNQLAGRKMNTNVYAIITQISRTNHLYAISCEQPLSAEAITFATKLAESERAIIFAVDVVLDSKLQLLIGADAATSAEAELPFFESSNQRKQKTMEVLAAKQLQPLENLPTIVADEVVRLREPAEVAKRFLCVAAVAMRADSNGKFDAQAFLEKYDLLDSVTDNERAFLDQPVDESNQAEFSWRYEAAWALLWSLKQVDELGFPDNQSDAEIVINAATKNAEAILAIKELRSPTEILDAVDLLYRCNWITTNDRVQGKQTEGLSGSVIYERLYGLNWLIHHQNVAWDDVRNDS